MNRKHMTLTNPVLSLQKAGVGEEQDGAVVSFYWCSILHGYLLTFCWRFWYIYYILILLPLP